MSPAFIKGVRENFGNAELVFDKFHVIQEANSGVEAVRRLEAQQDEAKARQLAKSQWIFRKNPQAHGAGSGTLGAIGLATFDDRAGLPDASWSSKTSTRGTTPKKPAGISSPGASGMRRRPKGRSPATGTDGAGGANQSNAI